jgi:Tfp pilus assembly protein PilF
MSSAPLSRDSILAQAELLREEGRYQEAILLLEHLIAELPDDVEALEELADNELSLEHFDRAKIAATRALTLDPKSAAAHYVLGLIASQEEEWELSAESLKTANTLSPNHPEILRCLGWTLFHNGSEIQGMVTLERSLNLDPENPLALCDLGVICLKQKDATKAKALLKRALDVDPLNTRAQECFEMVSEIEREERA